MNKTKLGVIFLGRTRPGFDVGWGATMNETATETIDSLGIPWIKTDIEVIDDASMKRALADLKNSKSNSLLLLQTRMADPRLSLTLYQQWHDPISLWATPENPDSDVVSSCSLVGVHAMASALKHLGVKFNLVYGNPDDDITRGKLRDAVLMSYTAHELRHSRTCLIGGQAPGYFVMTADPFEMASGLDMQMHIYSLVQFENVVKSISPEAINADMEALDALNIPVVDVSRDDMRIASALYLAMRHYFENENMNALAIRCWPEMISMFGQWPYLGLARLASEGYPVACEGDQDGANSALIAACLGMGDCYLSDWLEHKDDTVTLWHGGNAPLSLCPEPGTPGGPKITTHFNSGHPAVLDSDLKPNMPVTVFRFWRVEGKYHVSASNGEIVPTQHRFSGTYGLARLCDRNAEKWFEKLCYEGMPHHVCVCEGHHRDLLERFARLMKFKVV